MRRLRALWWRIAGVFASGRHDRELADELDAHVALHVEDLVRRGVDPLEARRQALIRLGGLEPVKERYREQRGWSFVDTTLQDVRYALRQFTKAPGFSAVAVLTLALGIAAVTVIYSVVHHVVLDPLPYRDANRLVNVLIEDVQRPGRSRTTMPPPEFLDYQQQSSVFEDVIGTLGTMARYETSETVEYVRTVWVTPNFFEFMGIDALLGRIAVPADGRPDAPPIVVLRHRAWVGHFNRDPDIIGKTILVNGERRTIVGVMPPRFTWHAADLWIPAPLDGTLPQAQAGARNFQARLKPGVSLDEAEAQLNVIAARRARERPAEYPETFRVRVVNVIDYTIGRFSTTLYVALGAVGLLMLIACCNVANMLLARATTRAREMTIRAALGAGRLRIVRQLLIESLLLALAGAGAGCLIAYVGIDALVGLLPQSPLPGEIDIRLNIPVLVFSLGTAVTCALLFGIAPALYSARRDLVHALKGAGPAIAGAGSGLRNTLVIAEIALSMVLLLAAGVLMRSFVSIVRVDLGMDPENILVLPIGLPQGEYTSAPQKRRFYTRVVDRVGALPGIAAAAATTGIPPYGPGTRSEVEIAGELPDAERTALVQWCSEDYFRTVGVGVVQGAGLPSGAGEAPRAAVVNQTFAATYFRGRDPLGAHVKLTTAASVAGLPWDGDVEIVGIVPDVKNQGLHDAVLPHVYLPGPFPARGNPLILVRAHGDPALLLNAIRRELRTIEPRAGLVQPTTLEQMLDRLAYAQPRFTVVVLGTFAGIGTLLVAVGVFSVLAYTVSRQTREIAVRMALGASPRSVAGVMLGLTARLVAAGAVTGALASLATGRLLANQLVNTSPHDLQALAAAIGVVTIVAFAACFVPARRAMHVEPMTALRRD